MISLYKVALFNREVTGLSNDAKRNISLYEHLKNDRDVSELATLIENEQSEWFDEFGRLVPLLNDRDKQLVLNHLKTHVQMRYRVEDIAVIDLPQKLPYQDDDVEYYWHMFHSDGEMFQHFHRVFIIENEVESVKEDNKIPAKRLAHLRDWMNDVGQNVVVDLYKQEGQEGFWNKLNKDDSELFPARSESSWKKFYKACRASGLLPKLHSGRRSER